METKTNVKTVENAGVVVENNENNEINVSNKNSIEAICKQLIVEGAKRINNVKVKNVTADVEKYPRLSFTIDREIPAMIIDAETMEYKEGLTSVFFTSCYAIAGLIKTYEDYAFLGNLLNSQENFKANEVFLSGSTIDIIQQVYPAGTEVVNPFSNSANPKVYDHDVIINYIVSIKFSKMADKARDVYMLKCMGF